jgi:hypothetical protein
VQRPKICALLPKELIIPSEEFFIRVEKVQEFTLEDYFKQAAENLSDELGIAVYPAGTPRTSNCTAAVFHFCNA